MPWTPVALSGKQKFFGESDVYVNMNKYHALQFSVNIVHAWVAYR